MADVTLTGVARSGDRLTLTGSGFTKTTTTVFVGEDSVPFDWASDAEISIAEPEEAGAKISVEKGGVTTDEFDIPPYDEEAAASEGQAQAAPAAGAGAAGDLNMDPREPYPTGNPPDPKEAFKRIHGRYPDEEET